MQLCETINKDMDFIFNPSNMWEYFNFEMLSREELHKFISLITKHDLNMNDVSYKGNNKNWKTYPKINKPLNSIDEQTRNHFNLEHYQNNVESDKNKQIK